MKKLLLFLWVFLFIPFFADAAENVVINRVQFTGGSGLANNDFIELYNSTAFPINVSGWKLRKRIQSGTESSIRVFGEGKVIPVQGYFIWANSDKGFAASINADESSTATLSDNSSAALFDSSDNLIDSYSWGSGHINPFDDPVADEPGDSQSPGDTGIDNPGGSNADEFLADQPPVSQGEPAAQNLIVITEIFPNPAGIDSGSEWIELFNSSSQPIDLSGWILDDEPPASGGIGSSAYTIPPSFLIPPQAYLAITLPAGFFALDNSGNETVRLFSPDQNLAASISYGAPVPENESYARKADNSFAWTDILTPGSANQFSIPQGPAGLSQQEDDEPALFDPVFFNLRVVEIYPNPPGADTGNEWVEVANIGQEPISLHGWTLADGAVGAKISARAWNIASPTILPGEVELLVIPAGKFALNNSGIETVRLFAADLTLVDAVSYEGTEEGRAYAFMDGTWNWNIPTPGELNSLIAGESESTEDADIDIIINEVYPEPPKGADEFIELYNPNQFAVDLSGWSIADSAVDFKIKKLTIAAGGLAVIYKAESKIALNNFGPESVSLRDKGGNVVWELEFEDAPKLKSLNYFQGSYSWTDNPTPGKPNRKAATAVVKPVEDTEEEDVAGDDDFAEEIFLEDEGMIEGEYIAAAGLAPEEAASNSGPAITPPLWLAIGFVSGVILCYIYFIIYRKRGLL